MSLPNSMPDDLQAIVREAVDRLTTVPGLVALALGGSYASGSATARSDVDLGLFYLDAAPFKVDEIRRVADLLSQHSSPVVTDFYEWGPWVNGGAWIDTRGGRVDFIYRSVDHVRRVIREAREGGAESNFFQTPVYGFHSVTYLGETHIARPLYDPEGLLEGLKREVDPYPPALRGTLVQKSLWGAEFTLGFTREFARHGDVYNTLGCLTRTLAHLTQALFALNETYFLNDKRAIETIESMESKPADYGARVRKILAHAGGTADELSESTRSLEELFRDVVSLAGSAYAPKYPLPRAGAGGASDRWKA